MCWESVRLQAVGRVGVRREWGFQKPISLYQTCPSGYAHLVVHLICLPSVTVSALLSLLAVYWLLVCLRPVLQRLRRQYHANPPYRRLDEERGRTPPPPAPPTPPPPAPPTWPLSTRAVATPPSRILRRSRRILARGVPQI